MVPPTGVLNEDHIAVLCDHLSNGNRRRVRFVVRRAMQQRRQPLRRRHAALAGPINVGGQQYPIARRHHHVLLANHVGVSVRGRRRGGAGQQRREAKGGRKNAVVAMPC